MVVFRAAPRGPRRCVGRAIGEPGAARHGAEYPHQFVNTSAASMKYLSISTQERPEICEYPDSGKYMAHDKGFRGAQRSAANLDYWDGEP